MIEEKSFYIKNHQIGGEGIPYIIAEVGQAHDGSLGMAHSYIEIASKIGVNAIKFQTHIANEESTLEEQFRVNFSLQDNSRFEYWKRMEFTEEQWIGLYQHAVEKKIDFLSSPFSVSAFNLLERLKLPAWKVGSGEFKSMDLLECMIKTGKPILYSTGMSNNDEIDFAYKYFNSFNHSFAFLQCTSMYPTPLKYLGINLIKEFKEKYNIPIGFSDHSGGVVAPICAISNGANLIEAHIVFDKEMFGPDSKSSLDIHEFEFLVKANREIHEMYRNPVDKNILAAELKETRNLFTKSISTTRDLEKGEIVTKDLLILKKPGTGINASNLELIIGMKAKNKIYSNKLLTWDDLEK